MRYGTTMIDLRLGDYREVMQDVEPDAVIVDPPYGARTHAGHRDGVASVDGWVRSDGTADPAGHSRELR